MRKWIWILLSIVLLAAVAAAAAGVYVFAWSPDCSSWQGPDEVSITEIPLSAPLDRRSAEVSGMDWYGDYLIILPQYFDFADNRAVYAIPKAEILAYLEAPTAAPPEVIRIPVIDRFLGDALDGFEGYESIAFSGDQVFLTIETSPNRHLIGYLVSGEIDPSLSKIVLDESSLQQINLPVQLFNSTDEAMLVAGDRVVTFFEANGVEVNPDPAAQVFDLDKNPLGSLPFPSIEYRVTDATRLDEANNFWIANQFSFGSLELRPGRDPLVETYGQGCTHAHASFTVERLVEMHYDPQAGITLTDTPPIQLRLDGDFRFHNWEAIARLDNLGFLVATDKYPGTVLAFVPYP